MINSIAVHLTVEIERGRAVLLVATGTDVHCLVGDAGETIEDLMQAESRLIEAMHRADGSR